MASSPACNGLDSDHTRRSFSIFSASPWLFRNLASLNHAGCLLDLPGRRPEIPALERHHQCNAVAGAAVGAEPRTAPLLVIKAEAISAATDRARPMLTGQLALCQAKAEQQAGPLPEGNVTHAKPLHGHLALRFGKRRSGSILIQPKNFRRRRGSNLTQSIRACRR